MKKIALNILALGLAGIAFTACNDAKNDVIENMVYISEAVVEPSADIILGQTGEQSKHTLTVRMAQKAAVDTKVTLAIDPAALETYNRVNDTEFQVIPLEHLNYPSTVVIPAGSSMATVELTVTSFDGEKGVEYAAPFKITAAEGVDVSTGSNTFVYIFGKPLVQLCPKFNNDNAMKIPFDETVELSTLTLEWWARVVNTAGNNGFSVNNQALFSFNSSQQLYIRFGDLTYGGLDGRIGNHNFLQIKTCGIDANYDTGDPRTDKGLKWGEWIHFAHTYNGATGECILYKDGVEVCRVDGGAGKVFDISGATMCGSGSYYFRDNVEFAQVRLWKVVRTPQQIAKNMKKEVKYNDPNLVFYFPMNEGEGSILHDVTGNGHDITIGSADNGGRNQAYAWTEYTF